MSPRLTILAALFLALMPWAVAQESAASPAPGSDQRFTEVPDFSFTDANGETLTRADLLGEPWVAIPFFVRCTGPCPNLTTQLRARVFPRFAGTPIRMVSFSVDPKFDDPVQLADYAKRFDIDLARWSFVTGDADAMATFVRDGLKVGLDRDDSLEPGEAVTHGTRLPVIDAEGVIAGWYECADASLTPEELDGNFERLIGRARALAGLREPSAIERKLPLVNASLNGLAGVLLLLGLIAIKKDQRSRHEHLMKAAFFVSAAFLASYLWYHVQVIPLQGGPTPFNGTGGAQVAYLALLASHVILAAVNLPMILRTFWLAHKEDWVRHRAWARITFPIWLYVSVTGVLVYLVLYPFNPAPGA
jgi:protein SCO1